MGAFLRLRKENQRITTSYGFLVSEGGLKTDKLNDSRSSNLGHLSASRLVGSLDERAIWHCTGRSGSVWMGAFAVPDEDPSKTSSRFLSSPRPAALAAAPIPWAPVKSGNFKSRNRPTCLFLGRGIPACDTNHCPNQRQLSGSAIPVGGGLQGCSKCIRSEQTMRERLQVLTKVNRKNIDKSSNQSLWHVNHMEQAALASQPCFGG